MYIKFNFDDTSYFIGIFLQITVCFGLKNMDYFLSCLYW